MAPTTASSRAPRCGAYYPSVTSITSFWFADNAAHVERANASAVTAAALLRIYQRW